MTQDPRAWAPAVAVAAHLALAPAALAQGHGPHHPAPAEPPKATAPAGDHGPHPAPAADPATGADASMTMGEEGAMAMTGALGPYAMTREAGGTAWQPDAAPHGGLHFDAGGWMVMGHALLDGVWVDQTGPRGDEDVFVGGMIMAMARRDLGPGTLQLRAMVSPDPFMGPEGYPLLLAAGETADGVTPLVDRQHPHDLFMELSASYSLPLGEAGSLFVYGGLPGEPAFGPPAYMHRASAGDSPEAPISHHWFDSTHVTFGVVTAGFVHGDWKVEASAFRGREPDQNRWDIETGDLDSRAVRIGFNPTENWSLQASWADIVSPEALEPLEDEERVSLSALYARPVGAGGQVFATAAWARKDKDGERLDAWLLETAWRVDDAWTLFGRAEQVDQDELTPGGGHGPVVTVRKAAVGAIHDWRLSDAVKFGVGGLVDVIDAPGALGYGDAGGGMVFVRLKVG